MRWPAIRTKVTSTWQKLASMIALLSVAVFVSHAVAAEGVLLHAQDHTIAQAEAPYLVEDTPDAPDRSHEHSSVTVHQHSDTGKGKPTCCGEACLIALMLNEALDLDEPWAARSKISMSASSLVGHDPEGLHRPPRLSHCI
jgi:hypothetical protein